jgi:hypothetical protein
MDQLTLLYIGFLIGTIFLKNNYNCLSFHNLLRRLLVPQELLGQPAYTGMKAYRDQENGYTVWVPSDWHKFDLTKPHRGMMFSPYNDDINTCMLFEKHHLKYKIKEDDLPVLREGFTKGILDLPGVEIESQLESLSETVNLFEARFSFLEGENRRKRWVRNIYWGDGQLVCIGQGRTVEDFEYWLPMIYNSFVTLSVF